MISIDEPRPPARRFALFAAGFRPFFLAAGFYAGISALAWVAVWLGLGDVSTALPLSLWHAHEMLFGFAAAALAGFLLTAVPNWTGSTPLRGRYLVILFVLWLAGRLTAWGSLGALGFAVADLLFLPGLAAVVGPGIMARNARRNGVFVLLIGVMTAANAAVHLQALDVPWASARWGIMLAIGVLTLMVTIIGGRIVPAFTIGGMRMAGRPLAIEPSPRLDLACILAVAGVVVGEALSLPAVVVGALAAVAAALNAVRLSRWHPLRTRTVPLVWILHVGYAWLIVGLAVKASAVLFGVPTETTAVHALTAGMAGTMILAVMSRAALGHSGRALVADPWTVLAYVLVIAGALARVLGPMLSSANAPIAIAGVLWSAGFLVFALRYLPWLVGPRPDGRNG